MKNTIRSKQFVCVALFLGGADTSASSLVDFGVQDEISGGLCAPFGCFGYFDSSETFQQIYVGSKFGAAPIEISSVTFFLFEGLSSNQTLGAGQYSIYFSTTSKTPESLDPNNLEVNVGDDETLFFSGELSGAIPGGTLEFVGDNFRFDPMGGNLLLRVVASDLRATTGGWAYFNIYRQPEETSAVFTATPRYPAPIYLDEGLITRFGVSRSSVAEVPLPGTFSFLGIGLVTLGVIRRRATDAQRP